MTRASAPEATVAARAVRAAVCAIALVTAACAHPAGPEPHPAALEPATARLANGLRIVVAPRPTHGTVIVTVVYGIGSERDPHGMRGLAHATEHMMFRGTRTLPGTAWADALAALGATSRATTGPDATVFTTQTSATALRDIVRLEADRMENLALRAEDWNHERRAVIEEIAKDYDDPTNRLVARVRAAAYDDRSSAESPLGDPAEIASIPIAAIRRRYDEAFGPNHAVVIVAGDVSRNVVRDVSRAFGHVRARGGASAALGSVRPRAGASAAIRDRDTVGSVLLAYAVPGFDSASSGAEAAASMLLSDPGSPLRGRLAGIGAISASLTARARSGLLYVYVRPRTHVDTATIVAAARRGVRDTFDERAVRDAMPAVRRWTSVAELSSGESLSMLSDRLALESSRPGFRFASRSRDVEGLSVADVRGFADGYLTEPAAVGVVRPGAPDVSAVRLPADPAASRAEAPGVRHLPDTAALPPGAEPLRGVRFGRASNGLRYAIAHDDLAPTISLSAHVAGVPTSASCAGAASAIAAGGERYSPRERTQLLAEHGMRLELGASSSGHALAADAALLLGVFADAVRHPALRAVPPACRQLLGPDALTIALAGNVDADDVARRLEELFGDWHPASEAAATTTAPPASGASSEEVAPSRVRATTTLAFSGPAAAPDAPKRAGEEILFAVLQERLLKALRFERGLSYAVDVRISDGPDGARWTIRTDVRSNDAVRARAIVVAAVAGLASTRPEPYELRGARRRLLATRFLFDGRGSALSEMRYVLDNGLSADSLGRAARRIRTVPWSEASAQIAPILATVRLTAYSGRRRFGS